MPPDLGLRPEADDCGRPFDRRVTTTAIARITLQTKSVLIRTQFRLSSRNNCVIIIACCAVQLGWEWPP